MQHILVDSLRHSYTRNGVRSHPRSYTTSGGNSWRSLPTQISFTQPVPKLQTSLAATTRRVCVAGVRLMVRHPFSNTPAPCDLPLAACPLKLTTHNLPLNTGSLSYPGSVISKSSSSSTTLAAPCTKSFTQTCCAAMACRSEGCSHNHRSPCESRS